MKFGIRRRVFLVSLLVVVAVTLTSLILLEIELRGRLEERAQANLAHLAEAGRVTLEGLVPGSLDARADAVADALGAGTESRVTIIDVDGKVLGDSEVAGDELADLDNHGSRPEVRDTRAHGRGVARRYSATLGTDMLYVAVPFEVPAGSSGAPERRGVVRLATPLSEVDSDIRQLRFSLLFAGLAALVLAIFAAALAAQLLTQALRQLAERAEQLSAGVEGAGQPQSGDEVQHLEGSFQRMANALERALGKLAAERDRVRAVLQGTDEPVIAIDANQQVTACNDAALAVFGVTKGKGRPLVEMIRQPALLDALPGVLEGTPASVEMALPRPFPQTPRELVVRATPAVEAGGAVLVFHDVTQLRKLETMRRDFVANVSHELRTPVSVIRANAELVLDHALEDDLEGARAFVEAILRQSESLSRLVDGLLDISRIESGTVQLEVLDVHLVDVVEEVCEALSARANDKGVRVHHEVADEQTVRADPGVLGQVLQNLVENAIAYCDDGGAVCIRAKQLGARVRLEVIDDGPGVPQKHRVRIFERFYRVDKGRSRAAGGTGLGLSIVKHLTTAMGGNVGFEPNTPHGSVFWVELDGVGE